VLILVPWPDRMSAGWSAVVDRDQIEELVGASRRGS
jgi:hypothetical protein